MVDDTPVQKLPEQEKNTSEKFTTHTVVKGDTLYSLAKKYGTTVPEIVALNPSIEDGKTISIGQTYIMTSNKNPLDSKKLPDLKNSSTGYIEHTVVKGDTLYSLSRKYGTTVDAVVAANPEITDGQSIKIGHTYKFPSGNKTVKEIPENISEENINNNFEEETLSAEMPDVSSENEIRVPASSGIEKDPKIENLIAKIKAAQSFIKSK